MTRRARCAAPIFGRAALIAAIVLSWGPAAAETPSPDKPNALSDMIRFMSSQEMRDRYALNGPVSNLHSVMAFDTDVVGGLKLFFASYPDEAPAGLRIAVLADRKDGSPYGEIYQCPDEGGHCVFDPARPRETIPDGDLWRYGHAAMRSGMLGTDPAKPDIFPVKNDGNDRIEGRFMAIFDDEAKALSAICVALDSHEAGSPPLSNEERTDIASYCYSFPLRRVTFPTEETTTGYFPDDETRLRRKRELETLMSTEPDQ
ncbi:MAG: hypothetical protein ACK5MQ_13320 [Pikeienuella sp.]